MERLEKVATPPKVGRASCTESVSIPGVAVSLTEIRAVELVAVELFVELLDGSCDASGTAGEMAAPAVAFVGWTVKASFDAAAALMLNPEELAPVSGADAAVSV